MIVYSAARIILTFGAASLMTIVTALPVVAHAKVAVTTAKPADPAAAQTKFCYRGPVQTGSLVALKTCKTREQWAAEGVTIDEKGRAHEG